MRSCNDNTGNIFKSKNFCHINDTWLPVSYCACVEPPVMCGFSGSDVSIVVALEWAGCVAPVDKTWSDLKSLFTYLPSTGIDVIQ